VSALPHPRLHVAPDNPAYRQQAAAEAEFWARPQPGSIEAGETRDWAPTQTERYHNERLTGDPSVPWPAVLGRYGRFGRGLVLGTSSLRDEADLLAANPDLHVTFVDISAGALARREEHLGARFPGRVRTRVADLNFVAFERAHYDVIVSAASMHHVTNLEHLAGEIDAALTSKGYFFLYDYAGENRFQFSLTKKGIFEAIFARDVARRPGRACRVEWLEPGDLSPFCGVRSEDVLAVLRARLVEVSVRVAGTLIVPLLRVRVVEEGAPITFSRLQRLTHRLRLRFPGICGRPARQIPYDPRFFDELTLVGELLAEAGVLLPGNVLAVYRKRPGGFAACDGPPGTGGPAGRQ
jgi:SAM-dependent methyltransferase